MSTSGMHRRHFEGRHLVFFPFFFFFFFRDGSFCQPTHRCDAHRKFFWWSLLKIELKLKVDTSVVLGVKGLNLLLSRPGRWRGSISARQGRWWASRSRTSWTAPAPSATRAATGASWTTPSSTSRPTGASTPRSPTHTGPSWVQLGE